MAEASSEIQQVLRQSMADLVAHMVERLKDGADGKPLKFKPIDRIESRRVPIELLFPQRDRRSAVAESGGPGPRPAARCGRDDLRTSGDMRTRVQQEMAALGGGPRRHAI